MASPSVAGSDPDLRRYIQRCAGSLNVVDRIQKRRYTVIAEGDYDDGFESHSYTTEDPGATDWQREVAQGDRLTVEQLTMGTIRRMRETASVEYRSCRSIFGAGELLASGASTRRLLYRERSPTTHSSQPSGSLFSRWSFFDRIVSQEFPVAGSIGTIHRDEAATEHRATCCSCFRTRARVGLSLDALVDYMGDTYSPDGSEFLTLTVKLPPEPVEFAARDAQLDSPVGYRYEVPLVLGPHNNRKLFMLSVPAEPKASNLGRMLTDTVLAENITRATRAMSGVINTISNGSHLDEYDGIAAECGRVINDLVLREKMGVTQSYLIQYAHTCISLLAINEMLNVRYNCSTETFEPASDNRNTLGNAQVIVNTLRYLYGMTAEFAIGPSNLRLLDAISASYITVLYGSLVAEPWSIQSVRICGDTIFRAGDFVNIGPGGTRVNYSDGGRVKDWPAAEMSDIHERIGAYYNGADHRRRKYKDVNRDLLLHLWAIHTGGKFQSYAIGRRHVKNVFDLEDVGDLDEINILCAECVNDTPFERSRLPFLDHDECVDCYLQVMSEINSTSVSGGGRDLGISTLLELGSRLAGGRRFRVVCVEDEPYVTTISGHDREAIIAASHEAVVGESVEIKDRVLLVIDGYSCNNTPIVGYHNSVFEVYASSVVTLGGMVLGGLNCNAEPAGSRFTPLQTGLLHGPYDAKPNNSGLCCLEQYGQLNDKRFLKVHSLEETVARLPHHVTHWAIGLVKYAQYYSVLPVTMDIRYTNDQYTASLGGPTPPLDCVASVESGGGHIFATNTATVNLFCILMSHNRHSQIITRATLGLFPYMVGWQGVCAEAGRMIRKQALRDALGRWSCTISLLKSISDRDMVVADGSSPKQRFTRRSPHPALAISALLARAWFGLDFRKATKRWRLQDTTSRSGKTQPRKGDWDLFVTNDSKYGRMMRSFCKELLQAGGNRTRDAILYSLRYQASQVDLHTVRSGDGREAFWKLQGAIRALVLSLGTIAIDRTTLARLLETCTGNVFAQLKAKGRWSQAQSFWHFIKRLLRWTKSITERSVPHDGG